MTIPVEYDPEVHRRHLTDGRWHDDCLWCLRRRRHGGTGLPDDPADGEARRE